MTFLRYLFLGAVALILLFLAMANRQMVELRLIPQDLGMTLNFQDAISLPLFVVMTITPLAARVPYNAAALGPFNTVTDSISSGLMSETLLEPPSSLPALAPEATAEPLVNCTLLI